jgi:ABC-type transport system involved in multi-copper enzyme maturation permease subunit
LYQGMPSGMPHQLEDKSAFRRWPSELTTAVGNMSENPTNPIPAGVRAIGALFALCAIYLVGIATLMLLRPGTVSMSAGAPLLFGLELAGPYMFLLIAIVGGAIALGLLRLSNIARRAAI